MANHYVNPKYPTTTHTIAGIAFRLGTSTDGTTKDLLYVVLKGKSNKVVGTIPVLDALALGLDSRSDVVQYVVAETIKQRRNRRGEIATSRVSH